MTFVAHWFQLAHGCWAREGREGIASAEIADGPPPATRGQARVASDPEAAKARASHEGGEEWREHNEKQDGKVDEAPSARRSTPGTEEKGEENRGTLALFCPRVWLTGGPHCYIKHGKATY